MASAAEQLAANINFGALAKAQSQLRQHNTLSVSTVSFEPRHMDKVAWFLIVVTSGLVNRCQVAQMTTDFRSPAGLFEPLQLLHGPVRICPKVKQRFAKLQTLLSAGSFPTHHITLASLSLPAFVSVSLLPET